MFVILQSTTSVMFKQEGVLLKKDVRLGDLVWSGGELNINMYEFKGVMTW